MKQHDTIKKLTALAHDGRLNLFRRLVEVGKEGETAGELARFVGAQTTTASAQMQVLLNADLVTCQRKGRHVVYSANFAAIKSLMEYLLENCCGGHCNPVTISFNKKAPKK